MDRLQSQNKQEMKEGLKSPMRQADGLPDWSDFKSIDMARKHYGEFAKKATEDLMQFIQALSPGKNPLCVTYFDEAHELELRYWIVLRLLQAQASSTRMWYVFMGTKSSISYYNPAPENRESFSHPCPLCLIVESVLSLKLRNELRRLVPPYIALDFDQHVINSSQSALDVPVSQLDTIEHLARYGRPLYAFLLSPHNDHLASYQVVRALA